MVAGVTAVDPDGADPVFGDLQYSIINGDIKNQFAIDVSSGHISLRRILDFESIPSYNLLIQVSKLSSCQ